MKKLVLPLHTNALVPVDYDNVVTAVAASIDGDDTAYRIYNEAVVAWVKSRLVGASGTALPVIPSPPQNAFANYRKLLIELGHLKDCPEGTNDFSNLPLPMVSVHFTGESDREGSRGQFPLRGLGTHAETQTKFTRYPKPLWFNYSIDMWALKKRHISWIKQRFTMSFRGKLAHTRVQHSPFETKFLTAIWNEGMEDQSQVSRADAEELVMRSVLTIKVEAWMWDDILSAPQILQVTETTDDVDTTMTFAPGANLRVTPTAPPPGDAG